MFTPSTKAEVGEHDEAITFADVERLVGADRAAELRELTLALYVRGAELAREAGIVLADTKFEFGVAPSGELVLGDEVLTPDSSRFWPAATWSPGATQPSYDKQFVRDWLTSSGWDRVSPPPELPDDVVAATRERYVIAYEQLTGRPFALRRGGNRDRARPAAARPRGQARAAGGRRRRPQAGDLRPPGAGGARRARPARPRQRARASGRASTSCSRSTARPTRPSSKQIAETLLANPVIEDVELHLPTD